MSMKEKIINKSQVTVFGVTQQVMNKSVFQLIRKPAMENRCVVGVPSVLGIKLLRTFYRNMGFLTLWYVSIDMDCYFMLIWTS